jgi:hypothetical protein
MELWAEGESATLIAGAVGVLLLLPPPHAHKNNKPDKITTSFFMTKLPPVTPKVDVSLIIEM